MDIKSSMERLNIGGKSKKKKSKGAKSNSTAKYDEGDYDYSKRVGTYMEGLEKRAKETYSSKCKYMIVPTMADESDGPHCSDCEDVADSEIPTHYTSKNLVHTKKKLQPSSPTSLENEMKRQEKKQEKKKRQQEQKKRRQEELKDDNPNKIKDEQPASQTSLQTTSSEISIGEETTRRKKKNLRKNKMSEQESEQSVSISSSTSVDGFESRGSSATPNKDEQTEANSTNVEKNESAKQQVVKQASVLATKAAEEAQEGHYSDAITLYTQALALHENSKFYFNRAFCYERCGHYETALTDAQKSVSIDPNYIKGHYRKAMVLLALTRPQEAMESFATILKIDKNQDQVRRTLFELSISQLMELGFTKERVEKAMQVKKTFDKALEALLQGEFYGVNVASNDDSCSADEDMSSDVNSLKYCTSEESQDSHSSSDQLKCRTLYLGNLCSIISKNSIFNLFSRFGVISHLKLYTSSQTALINFQDCNSAEIAMNTMQGCIVGGKPVEIRYSKKLDTVSSNSRKSDRSNTSLSGKAKGPVKGNQCYFWLTSGCRYGDQCLFEHIPQNKGVDYVEWMNKTTAAKKRSHHKF